MPDTMERTIDRTDNRPPEVIDVNDPDALASKLARDHADLVRRFVELEIGIGQIPEKIADEPAAQRIVDFVGEQVRPLMTEARTTHDEVKKPYSACGKVVDTFFLRRIDKINNAIGPVHRRAEAYIKRKAEEQRRAEEARRRQAEEARQRAAAEAQRLAAEAAAKVAEGDRQTAIDLQTQAEEAQAQAIEAEKIVNAPPAPVRIHGDYGPTGFLVEKWRFRYEDLNKLPPRYWMPDDETVQKDIDAGARDIPGVLIWRDDRFQIRRC
jgi:pyruvate/2-oxoglutarate dehydrogenase complex dihydrolipoamide acyltransferase (E2) component